MVEKGKQIRVSAPGKLMLFGEHSVVYGRPSIVSAVDQRLYMNIEIIDSPVFRLDAPDVKVENYEKNLKDLCKNSVPKGAVYLEYSIRRLSKFLPIGMGLSISTISDFSSNIGFGSSSATVAGLVYALSQLLDLKWSKKQLFDQALLCVRDVKPMASGFDVASAIYGGFLYYIGSGKEIRELDVVNFPLIVAYTGYKTETAVVVGDIAKKRAENIQEVDSIFDAIDQIVFEAEKAFRKYDYEEIGRLMNENQILLQKLGVSDEKIDLLTLSAQKAGALGAKLSGAGRGDCVIVLAREQNRKKVIDIISKAGGEIVDIEIGTMGVRTEK